MTMTNEEIIREYREAKTPLKQIGILADENQCSRGKIVEILREAGMDLPAVYREKNAGERPAGAQAPSVSFADSSLPEGAKDGDANGDEEAAYGPILPAPKLAGFSERVNDGAIEVIARMVADSDKSTDRVTATLNFQERVRGVLALVHELRGAEA